MKSFLICHLGALGDFVLTWPAIQCLQQALPDYQFLGIGRLEYMRLAITLGLLDACIDKESARLIDFFSGRAVPSEIGSPHGAVIWLSRGQDIVNLLKKSASLSVISINSFPALQTHIACYYCSAIFSHFPINIPKDLSDCFPVREIKKGQYALIHPGSGSPRKNYLPQFYRGLADELRQFGCQKVGFIFGPVEREKMKIEEFAGEWIEQPENVEELADLLSGASLYIGNDSGVSHLSGYLGIPTVALYKTTDPKIWGVVGRRVVHISAVNEDSASRKMREWFRTVYTEIF
jgi:ADP-heptose:LPS heptosyltransferase